MGVHRLLRNYAKACPLSFDIATVRLLVITHVIVPVIIQIKLANGLSRAQFHRAAKHNNLLSMIKTGGLPTKFPRDFQDKQTTAEYQ